MWYPLLLILKFNISILQKSCSNLLFLLHIFLPLSGLQTLIWNPKFTCNSVFKKKSRFFWHKEAVIIVWLAVAVRLLLSSSWLAYTLGDATPVGNSQRLYNGWRGTLRRWWGGLIGKTALWRNAVKSRLDFRDHVNLNTGISTCKFPLGVFSILNFNKCFMKSMDFNINLLYLHNINSWKHFLNW